MHVPQGFHTVAPYFFVRDAEAFVAFLVQGLGGQESCRTMRADGTVQNVQVRIGDSTVMVSEASDRYPPMCGAFYLYVEDADAAIQRALDHGATLEMAVSDMPYGDRQGGVRDTHGHLWWISQRLTAAPYSP
jgi:PhnB protein